MILIRIGEEGSGVLAGDWGGAMLIVKRLGGRSSPANAEAAQLYRENMKEYVRRVKVSFRPLHIAFFFSPSFIIVVIIATKADRISFMCSIRGFG